MQAEVITYYENYTPVGDVAAMAVCFIFMILIHNAYINRTRNFIFLKHIIYLLLMASVSDMLFHVMMNYTESINLTVIYVLRLVFHMSLFAIL